MNLRKVALLPGALLICLAAGLLAGCAARVSGGAVGPGDLVSLQFTCREQSGEIAASSYPDVNSSSQPKSMLFVKRTRTDAISLVAGGGGKSATSRGRSFEDELLVRLAAALPGLRAGQEADLAIGAERQADAPGNDHTVKIARTRTHPKELQFSVVDWQRRYGAEPALGLKLAGDRALVGEVTELAGGSATVRYSVAAGKVPPPFGKEIVTDMGDHYRIDIQAVKGALVRTGGSAGRIAEVDDQYLTLDYGHPFGGETLNCSVKVESVRPVRSKEIAGASQSATNIMNRPEEPREAGAIDAGPGHESRRGASN